MPVPHVESFACVADGGTRVLVVGSMPGLASLRAAEYYAHPRNLFWDFMGEFFGAGRDLPYPERLRRLNAAGVALWDVVQRCARTGSLDANIDSRSILINDFAGFFTAFPRIRDVYCNGGRAADIFRRRVLPSLPEALRARLRWEALPSTSPANASQTRSDKRRRWQAVAVAAGGDGA